MGKDEAFTWVIDNFSSLQSEYIYSDQFVIGGCRWRLLAYPKGRHKDDNFSLYLDIADFNSLPYGWRRRAKFSFTIVNQSPEKYSKHKETSHWYDDTERAWGHPDMLSFTELHAKDSGFLVNDQLKILVAVTVIEVIGNLDVQEESEEATQPLKKIKLEDGNAVSSDLLNTTQTFYELNGFQLLPSQMKFMKRLFENHPDVALEFISKNPHLRTGYMNVLLSLTQKLCRSPQELSNDDMSDVGAALIYMIDGGFKLHWLEKKLDEVKEKKKKEEACSAQLQEMEEELKTLKQKCLDLETQMDKKKTEIVEARAPFSFDHLSS